MNDHDPQRQSEDLSRSFRVGILCNGPRLAAWQRECIRKVQELPFAEVVLIITNEERPAPRVSPLRKLGKKLSSGLLLWRFYERFVLERKALAIREVPFDDALRAVPTLGCSPISKGKWRQSFDEASLEEVRKHDLDILLRFGFGILTGDILALPRYGIWSFHHGDPEHFRGAPPGFWEIHNGAAVTGVILQRLTETLDGGVVLHAGWFKTDAASYPKSLDRILFGAAHFVARALVDLRRDPASALRQKPLENAGPVYRYPRTGAVLRFVSRSLGAWLANQYRSLFRHQQWNVGILRRPIDQLLSDSAAWASDAKEVAWLPERKGYFLADPFAFLPPGESAEVALIAEEFDWEAGVGRIATVDRPGALPSRPKSAIRSDFHLSYPYTIEFEGETWCIPECSESRQVAVYRLIPDGTWAMHKVIIRDFPAVDPTLFEHDGRWWLFCTSADNGPNEYLYAWHADHLFGEWEPHQANPLKVDVRNARPAGRPFMCKGQLIRPAQDCSRHYGDGISFNRILKLTPDQFFEEPVGKLTPGNQYSAGMHTISPQDDFVIVDGARWAFVGAEFRRALMKKIRRGR